MTREEILKQHEDEKRQSLEMMDALGIKIKIFHPSFSDISAMFETHKFEESSVTSIFQPYICEQKQTPYTKAILNYFRVVLKIQDELTVLQNYHQDLNQ